MKDDKKTIVHKASINLIEGETLSDFERELRNAGSKYLSSNFGELCFWMQEVFSQKVIFEVEKANEGGYQYYALDYDRKDDGSFSINGLMEVKRKITFVADDKIQKQLAEVGDWEQTSKDFWRGVV